MGNFVVKVDMKENVEEELVMANTGLLQALLSSGEANSVSSKANGVSRVASGLPGLA
jgi:DNA-binding sugar fermentation-stimulating protein